MRPIVHGNKGIYSGKSDSLAFPKNWAFYGKLAKALMSSDHKVEHS